MRQAPHSRHHLLCSQFGNHYDGRSTTRSTARSTARSTHEERRSPNVQQRPNIIHPCPRARPLRFQGNGIRGSDSSTKPHQRGARTTYLDVADFNIGKAHRGRRRDGFPPRETASSQQWNLFPPTSVFAIDPNYLPVRPVSSFGIRSGSRQPSIQLSAVQKIGESRSDTF